MRAAPRGPEGAPPARKLESPYIARFADSIGHMQGRAAPAAGDGERLFRTRDGKLVELPAGVTADDAARLEAEAVAAQKKLGQGPPPRAVPDVKKLVKKPPPKQARPPARGKPAARAPARAAASATTAAAALLRAAGTSKVAQYLAQRGAPVLRAGIGLLQTLKRNEQTHDSAGEKLQHTERAVVIPTDEGQSKSNAAQVTEVDSRPAPGADDRKAKAALTATLADNVPRSIEDVDNFKRDRKAQHAGADVLRVVQGDSHAVTSTFEDVTRAPPPAPPDHTPEELPPEERAPATAPMNLGQGAVAPLLKEHTDVSHFTKEADGKLKDEGISQEQLDMVDRGDLAEANREKKGLEVKARTEPLAVQKLAAQEAQAVDRDLRQEEKTGRDRMAARRKEALRNTSQKQKGTRTALEKKREEVAARINGIYQAAQDKVKKRLADLETESMKRFDAGNAAASKTFEDSVHAELERFKDDRYSGWFGWARKAKDWVLGMDDLPQVKAIFDRNRQTFVETISRLVDGITADQKRVIQECKDELAAARKAIKTYVDSLAPGLKDIGQKAAADMTAKLNELDELVSRKEEELAAQLKDKQAAAIKAIDEKIEKMKEAMSGALAKLGKLLLLAAKKFFAWALEKAGFALSTIEDIINKGTAVLKAIFSAPLQFVKNLVRAAGTGFESFGKNFLTHLKNAVFEWMTGSIQGLVLPATWDFKGILSVVFQMLGITYANFRSHLVKLIPEVVVKTLETTFTLVKTLVTEGPMAAWEQLKEIATEMKDAFIEAVKDWIKWKIVQKAIETILSLLIPGAGIIRAIIGIYDTIVFFIQRAKDIAQMVGKFLGSIAEIAAGNIGAAASALESGLARGLVLVIDFLARFLRLSGITRHIQAAIAKLRDKVDGVMAKVAAWIVAQARRLGRFIAQAGVPQDPNERLRLAAQAAVASARRLTGRVTRALLEPVLAAVRVRYGLSVLQPYEQDGTWWVRATVNPTVVQNLFIPSERIGSGPRPAEGANYHPLIGKLTQAVQMFTEWARRGTTPVAQQMLRQLELAREQAQALHEDQQRHIPPSTLQPRMQALASALRAIQALDPRYELVSVGEMAVTVLNARRQMPRTPLPPWTVLDPLLRPEYVRQLRDQEAGLNSMVADQALANREIFRTTGRSREEAAMRREFGRRMGNPPRTAAPHNPDQSLLGFRDPTGPSAVGAVNSHIGSQNPGKIPAIMSALNAISPLARLVTQLNFELSVV